MTKQREALEAWKSMLDANGEVCPIKAHHRVCMYYDTILAALQSSGEVGGDV